MAALCAFVTVALLTALPQIAAQHAHVEVGQQHLVRRHSSSVLEKADPGESYEDVVSNTPDLVAYWLLNDEFGVKVNGKGPACTGNRPWKGNEADACGVLGTLEGDSIQLGASESGTLSILPADRDAATTEINAMHEQPSLLPASPEDKAMTFHGLQHEKVVIPNHELINLASTGYPAKTIEMWFKAGELDGNYRTLFEDGSALMSGVNIYMRKTPGAATNDLFMYVWNREDSAEGERVNVEYGTPDINPQPLKCTIPGDGTYYAAFIFDQAKREYRAYYKQAPATPVAPGGSAGAVEEANLCGRVKLMPAMSVMAHAAGPDAAGAIGAGAVIGGTQGGSRLKGDCAPDEDNSAASLCVMHDDKKHNFIGTIDNVAIYNAALGEGVLTAHYEAGVTEAAPTTNR